MPELNPDDLLKMVREILQKMVTLNASDLHIKAGTPPVFRVAVGPESERKLAEALIPREQAAVPGGSKPFIRSYP